MFCRLHVVRPDVESACGIPRLADKRLSNDLQCQNDDLSAAYEEITATQYELKQQYLQLMQNQEELRQQERTLRQIRFSIDQSHDMMFWLDMTGKIRDVSGSVHSVLGYSHEDLESLDISAIDPKFTIDSGLEVSGLEHPVPGQMMTQNL